MADVSVLIKILGIARNIRTENRMERLNKTLHPLLKLSYLK